MSGSSDQAHEDIQRACVVGMGIVGIPVAAMLAEVGIDTHGLDIDTRRVEKLAEGTYPFASKEPGIDELLAKVHAAGTFHATTDAAAALRDKQLVIVVVQTPFDDDDNAPRYEALSAALQTVGTHLERGALVVVESTIAPGTMKQVVLPALEASSGMTCGTDFFIGHCPERVMPGKLLANLRGQDRVVGGMGPATTDRMMRLYARFVEGTLHPTDMTTAEVVKTAENAFRDVNIAFANEVARICAHVGADVWNVRELVNRVPGRNFHLPGTGVGGHCIPKDGLLLAHAARDAFETPVLHAARIANDAMPEATVQQLLACLGHADGSPGPRTDLTGMHITILGASYLPGSDDTRDTPTLPMMAALHELGAKVTITDPLTKTLGGQPILHDTYKALDGADAVILSTAHEEYLELDWARVRETMRGRVVLDGRGVLDATRIQKAGLLPYRLGAGLPPRDNVD